MITLISWRNIWRNPVRSAIVIGAIALGVWAAISMTGFATGMINSYINNSINNIVSHIQIHHENFEDDFDVRYAITDAHQLLEELRADPRVEAVTGRGLSNAMLSTTDGVRGIRIKAIQAGSEGNVTALDTKIVEGEYLDDEGRNPILISRRLADKLGLRIRSKIVLTFQDLEHEITAASFRVKGIFETGNNPFDDVHTFIRIDDFRRLLDSERNGNEILHEIAVVLHDRDEIDLLKNNLRQGNPDDLIIESYREIAPDLQLYESQISFVSYIYLIIIMLALVFGIINTMLMAVLERAREFGMLMAIGMKRPKVFAMVVYETLMLSLVAVPLGMLLGFSTIKLLGNYGINLSRYSESLKDYGMSEVIYFHVEPNVYLQVPIAVAITALISAIYPAIKAIRLKPVTAIRKM